MNESKYLEGGGEEFTEYLFSRDPPEKNSIQLTFDPPKDIPLCLHIFQELLMIFTDGMKYLFSDQDSVSITTLRLEHIILLNRYLHSIGFEVTIETFTVHDYLDNMIYPNFFMEPELINETTDFSELYYETFLESYIYRASFKRVV